MNNIHDNDFIMAGLLFPASDASFMAMMHLSFERMLNIANASGFRCRMS